MTSCINSPINFIFQHKLSIMVPGFDKITHPDYVITLTSGATKMIIKFNDCRFLKYHQNILSWSSDIKNAKTRKRENCFRVRVSPKAEVKSRFIFQISRLKNAKSETRKREKRNAKTRKLFSRSRLNKSWSKLYQINLISIFYLLFK